MGIFNQRKPRAFHHEYMFAGRRKERLKGMNGKAGAEDCASVKPASGGRLAKGVFLNATKYALRRNARRLSGGFFMTTAFAIILILLLVLLWRVLLYI